MSQAALARALGLSAAMVSKLRQRGMPVDSVEQARAWRDANLDPMLVKRVRQANPDAGGAECPVSLPDHVRIMPGVIELCARRSSDHFDVWADPLREAMRTLPREHWDLVGLTLEVWDQLIGERTLRKIQREASMDTEPHDDTLLSNDGLSPGDLVYMLACGLANLTPD